VDEFDTLGGYVASRSGRLPVVGDRFIVVGWLVVVSAVDGPRLEQVRVVKLKSTAPPPNKEKESRSAT
jgi:CBS domain containing-hemolysin-like protein